MRDAWNQNQNGSQAKWCIPVIPALERIKQEDCDDLQARLYRIHEYQANQYCIQDPVSINITITITKIKQKPKATKEGAKKTRRNKEERTREI